MQYNDKDRLLTREEVAERFGIGKRFLEASAKRGDGPPFVRVGRWVRYRVSDIHRWLEKNTVAGSD